MLFIRVTFDLAASENYSTAAPSVSAPAAVPAVAAPSVAVCKSSSLRSVWLPVELRLISKYKRGNYRQRSSSTIKSGILDGHEEQQKQQIQILAAAEEEPPGEVFNIKIVLKETPAFESVVALRLAYLSSASTASSALELSV